MKVLGIVPARAGSKGIPLKNIRPLGGKPLLVYTAEAARAAKRLTRVILSTEDERIAAVGRSCGLEVPFSRPAELASDTVAMLSVVQHAVRWVEAQGERVDAVCLLQPTTPFRTGGDIDACIELLIKKNADAVISCLPVPEAHNPHWVFEQNQEGLLHLSTGESTLIGRRQDLPAAYHRDGAVYVTRRDVVMEQDSLFGERLVGYRMDPDRSVNLDRPEDWECAERLVAAPISS